MPMNVVEFSPLPRVQRPQDRMHRDRRLAPPPLDRRCNRGVHAFQVYQCPLQRKRSGIALRHHHGRRLGAVRETLPDSQPVTSSRAPKPWPRVPVADRPRPCSIPASLPCHRSCGPYVRGSGRCSIVLQARDSSRHHTNRRSSLRSLPANDSTKHPFHDHHSQFTRRIHLTAPPPCSLPLPRFLPLPWFSLLYLGCHSERSEESPRRSNIPHGFRGNSTSNRFCISHLRTNHHVAPSIV